jgi:hypothetical protein
VSMCTDTRGERGDFQRRGLLAQCPRVRRTAHHFLRSRSLRAFALRVCATSICASSTRRNFRTPGIRSVGASREHLCQWTRILSAKAPVGLAAHSASRASSALRNFSTPIIWLFKVEDAAQRVSVTSINGSYSVSFHPVQHLRGRNTNPNPLDFDGLRCNIVVGVRVSKSR